MGLRYVRSCQHVPSLRISALFALRALFQKTVSEQGRGERIAARLGIACLGAAMLGGCSADVAMFRADSNWWSSNRPAPVQEAPTEALVGPDGRCGPGSEGQLHTVTLGMTECELIRIAGPADDIEIGAGTNGKRSTVITYPQGKRAGVYRFSSGLLVSIERPTEPQRGQAGRRS